MRIYTKNPDKLIFEISRRDWFRHGQGAIKDIAEDDIASIGNAMPNITESLFAYNIDIRKYSERTWGVWVDGDLLCVAVYKKGAMAVKALIEDMAGRMQMMEGYIAAGG